MVKKVCEFFGKKIIPADTRDSILDQARKYFCEKGYDGASVRDICEGANANISAIKYHFGGKEGLYRECFKVYGETRLNSVSKILTKANSIEELKLRIRLFCEDFIKEGFENMHTTKMICREIETENPLIDDIFQETFLKIFSALVELIEDAQDKNIIKKEIDAMIITSAFFHNLTTSIRLNHVGEKYYKRSLKDPIYSELFINNIIAIFFDGIKIQE